MFSCIDRMHARTPYNVTAPRTRLFTLMSYVNTRKYYVLNRFAFRRRYKVEIVLETNTHCAITTTVRQAAQRVALGLLMEIQRSVCLLSV